MYHRVGESQNEWEARYAIPAKRFHDHIHALARAGYTAVDIDTFCDWLEGKTVLPGQSFLLTFDDGFQGVREFAAPVLEQLDWPYTVFLVSDLIGGKDEWTFNSNPDRRTFPLLNRSEIQDMQGRGCSFQSHTCSHAKLPSLSDDELVEELGRSRSELRKLLGQQVDYLAYPYGLVDERVEKFCQAAGYRAAFSTRSGFNREDVNRFQIRRIEVYGTDTPAMVLRKIKLGCNDGSLTHMARYYLTRLMERFLT